MLTAHGAHGRQLVGVDQLARFIAAAEPAPDQGQVGGIELGDRFDPEEATSRVVCIEMIAAGGEHGDAVGDAIEHAAELIGRCRELMAQFQRDVAAKADADQPGRLLRLGLIQVRMRSDGVPARRGRYSTNWSVPVAMT